MRDFFCFHDDNENEVPRHWDSNTKKPRHRDSKTKKLRLRFGDYEIREHHDIEKCRQISQEIMIPRHFFRGQKAITLRFQD